MKLYAIRVEFEDENKELKYFWHFNNSKEDIYKIIDSIRKSLLPNPKIEKHVFIATEIEETY